MLNAVEEPIDLAGQLVSHGAGIAEQPGLTPARVLNDFAVLGTLPAAAYLDQLPRLLQMAEEALYTFEEPGEEHDEMTRAYKAVGDQYGAWLTLQGRHGDLVPRLEQIEAALAAGGSADQAQMAWLDKLAGDADPVVPAPIARLLARAHSEPIPVAVAKPSSGPQSAGSGSDGTQIEHLNAADLDQALPDAMGKPTLSTPGVFPTPPILPAQDLDLAAIDAALTDLVGMPATAPAVRELPPSASFAGPDQGLGDALGDVAPRAPVPALPGTPQVKAGPVATTWSQWWQRWYAIGAQRDPGEQIAPMLQALQRLQDDLRVLAEGTGGALPPAVGEVYVAWRHRVNQALTALGYLKAVSDEVYSMGSRPFDPQRGISILDGMCDWGDLLADEVFWLLADEWWKLYMRMTQQTPAGPKSGDSVYTKNPQIIALREMWVQANRRSGEELIRRFMK